jgi:hypothetical protein
VDLAWEQKELSKFYSYTSAAPLSSSTTGLQATDLKSQSQRDRDCPMFRQFRFSRSSGQEINSGINQWSAGPAVVGEQSADEPSPAATAWPPRDGVIEL